MKITSISYKQKLIIISVLSFLILLLTAAMFLPNYFNTKEDNNACTNLNNSMPAQAPDTDWLNGLSGLSGLQGLNGLNMNPNDYRSYPPYPSGSNYAENKLNNDSKEEVGDNKPNKTKDYINPHIFKN